MIYLIAMKKINNNLDHKKSNEVQLSQLNDHNKKKIKQP